MASYNHQTPTPTPTGPHHQQYPYNIIDTDGEDHSSERNPAVEAVIAAFRTVDGLQPPPNSHSQQASSSTVPNIDLLDWLSLFFGFQKDNVRNQREHLVLHLANVQMNLNITALDTAVVRNFRVELLENYTKWCSYLAQSPNIWEEDSDQRRELLYVSLYLLIWGESANLRFLPECICYIFHHMSMELKKILDGHEITQSPFGENGFLESVVKPIYDTIKKEVGYSNCGTAPHSVWRNYDDLNEFFWSKRCFQELKWPIDASSKFFVKGKNISRVGKTGFVEQRSFLNLFRSFERLWVLLVVFLQSAIIIAWEIDDWEKHGVRNEDVSARVFLTVFFTWSGMRLLQSLLDLGMQYSLVSRETLDLGVRMVLKIVVAATWVVVFGVFYGRLSRDGSRSAVANFLMVELVFILPKLLRMVLFFLPCITDFLEKKNWRVFNMLSWWFQSRTFVGRGMKVRLVDKIKYTLFWVLVLGSKFLFSYYLQITPMIVLTKSLLNLKDVPYGWDKILKHSKNRSLVGLLWLPVVLIYLMDIQIWFSIYSNVFGVLVGWFAHLGQIRNIEQLGLRFQYFASAIQLNITPEKRPLNSNARGTMNYKFNDAIGRLKLRFGLGRPYKKLDSSNPANMKKFALIWNEMIGTFREEDIISDREHELLELPQDSWNVRVICWPCFFLCNELPLALRQAKDLKDATDKRLWYKICKKEYRRCAVIEAYDCIKHLLLEIIKHRTEEHIIVTNLFQEINDSLENKRFTKTFNMNALPQLHDQVIELVRLLIKKGEKGSTDTQVVNTLQALYEIAKLDFFKVKRSIEQLRQVGLAPRSPDSTNGLLFANAVELPDSTNETFYRQLRRLHAILASRDSTPSIPENLEARRRLAFFSNSLFMDMPRAPQVEKMMAFSVLTPYKDEDVLYSKAQLRTKNEDGISILYYLQTIYADEWKNFMQRMRREGMVEDEEIWTTKLRDLRLWASYKGQTLARTVRGMMYYYRALKLLAFLDSEEIHEAEGSRELCSMRRDSGLDGYNSERSSSSRSLSMKYTYVVSCHMYGKQKAKKDPRAKEILYLMENNEALRVAYVDEVSIGRAKEEKEYYSVLVKYDPQLKKEVEIYRIKLPGDPFMLGEGKPENQNHAIIFTRGDALQTIDMNQDNYFEEALKMRNLLEEFRRNSGIRKPTILGVREHIFTATVSSLAWFMSVQETSFVTLVQRVLANPLKVRMHYGHPDVFDRFWFLTRGGISKASRVINISEDIFAGFNCTLRGGNITHHEYIQVGKGREVGLNQVTKFEAKIAGGNGEQVLSRDVYRLGHRLDFFRMLSFFYGSVGFFFNTMIVILTAYAFLYGQLYLALSGVEASTAWLDKTKNKDALDTIINQQFIVQLGLFTALPSLMDSSVENGFLQVIWDFVKLQLQLSPVFYTFSLGTRAHYFGRTILHGGARYQATGRGFVVHHTSFAENYRLFSRSHFVKAMELGLMLIVYELYSPVASYSLVYIAMTMECWFLVVSWIMAPFVFNPTGFDWFKTLHDFDDFMKWIWYSGSSVFAKAEQSWERWWQEQNDHLRKTGVWGKIVEIILDLRFFFFQYVIVGRLHLYLLSWIPLFVAFIIFVVMAYAQNRYAAKKHIYYRLVQLLVTIGGILVVIALLKFTNLKFFDIFASLLAFTPTGWGLISIAQVFQPFLRSTVLWETVVSVARLYDMMFGMIVMVPVALLSWLPWFQSMQTRILFNEAFSRGLRIFQILKGKKKHES